MAPGTRTRARTNYYLHADHLGSVSEATSGSAPVSRIGQERYYPYGGVRYGSAPTSYNYTGQRLDGTGLLYYGARYYDPRLARFVQADTLVPQPDNPQSLNRFAYVLNNPLKYTDPTGHEECGDQACWEAQWYQSHGYKWSNKLGEWVYSGQQYYFNDLDALIQLLQEVMAGRWQIGPHASFHLQVEPDVWFSIEERGQDTPVSRFLASLGLITDVTDGAITGAHALWALGSIAIAVSAPTPEIKAAAAASTAASIVSYYSVSTFLLLVDAAGVSFAGAADVIAGRTYIDPAKHELAVGMDTLVSAFTASVSTLSLASPGWSLAAGTAGDAGQLYWDWRRWTGQTSGYSLVIRWR